MPKAIFPASLDSIKLTVEISSVGVGIYLERGTLPLLLPQSCKDKPEGLRRSYIIRKNANKKQERMPPGNEDKLELRVYKAQTVSSHKKLSLPAKTS